MKTTPRIVLLPRLSLLMRAVLSAGLLALFWCHAEAATLFTDPFTGVANPNDAGWYFRNPSSGGTAWITGMDNTAPLSGNTMLNPVGTSTWTMAFKHFAAFKLNNPGDAITVQLNFHSRASTSGVWEVGLLNTTGTNAGNSYGGTDPKADAAGYAFFHATSSTASNPQYAQIANDSTAQYSTKLFTVSQTAAEIDNLGHTLIFTLTETGTGVQISSSLDGVALDSTIVSSGTVCRDFNSVRLLLGSGKVFNVDNVSVTTTLGYTYYGSPLYNVTWPTPPTYASTEQAIFNVSGNTLPGQSALVTGAFSGTRKTVRLASLIGVSSAASALASSTLTVSGASQDSTGVSFTLPSAFKAGPFAFRIEDSDGTALTSVGNVPVIYWAQGIQSNATSTTAPLHEVLVSAVEQGQTLRLFGKNFPPESRVILTSTSGGTTVLTATTANPYALSLTMPSTQAPGKYTVKVGLSGTIDATYGAAVPLTVKAASTLVAYEDVVPGLVGNGITDNLAALQTFIDNNLPAAGEAEYIKINTSGTYAISSTLRLHKGQYLVGVPGVVLLGTPASTPPQTWVTGSCYFGMMDLAINAPVSQCVFSTDSTNGGHVVLYNVTVNATGDSSSWPGAFVFLRGPDIRMQSCTVNPGSGIPFTLWANGAWIENTAINNGQYGWNVFNNCKNVIVENCAITGADPEASSGISIWQSTDDNASCNIYSGNVSIQSIQGNNREALTTDGGGGAYAGLLESVSGTLMKLANDPCWNWSIHFPPVTNCVATIVAGKGVGQYRFLQSARGRYITVAEPWSVLPDTSSVISITGIQQHLIFYGNTIDYAGTIQFFGLSQDGVIAKNTLIDSAGINLWGLTYNGGRVACLNAEVVDNVMTGDAPPLNSTGQAQLYINNVHVWNRMLLSGALVRGNICSYPGVESEAYGGLNNMMGMGEFNAPGVNDDALADGRFLWKQNELVSKATIKWVTIHASEWEGVQFTTGNSGMTVTHVGRYMLPSHSGTHAIRIIDASTWITMTTGTVSLAGLQALQFYYAPLTAPVKLLPNKSYYLQSQETVNGDATSNYNGCVVAPGNGVTLNCAASGTTAIGLAGDSYGPVSLLYVQELPAIGAMYSFGTARNNATQWSGFRFTVGNRPMTVTQLGRWIIAGNSQSHTVKLVRASTGTDVPGGSAVVSTAGVTAGQFAYADLATPITLAANTSYYLESQETVGGDTFYDAAGTILVPHANMKINCAVSGSTETSFENHAYGPVNMMVTY